MIILVIMSIWSVSTFLMKWWQLRRSTRETVKFVPEFSRFLQEEHLDAAIALAEKTKQSHVARVLGEALAEVKPLLRDRATITAGRHQFGGAGGGAADADHLVRAEARPRHPGDHRRHGAVRGTARHHDGHRERVHRA